MKEKFKVKDHPKKERGSVYRVSFPQGRLLPVIHESGAVFEAELAEVEHLIGAAGILHRMSDDEIAEEARQKHMKEAIVGKLLDTLLDDPAERISLDDLRLRLTEHILKEDNIEGDDSEKPKRKSKKETK